MTENTIEIKVGYSEQSKGWVGEASVRLTKQLGVDTDLASLKDEVKRLADNLVDEVQSKSSMMTLQKSNLLER